MFYNLIKTPVLIKTGCNILSQIDKLLQSSHLIFPLKILITQENLYDLYKSELDKNNFTETILVKGGTVDEVPALIELCENKDVILVAFGGGSILDLVKYSASKMDKPYITIPSTLSNDAIYSCVARLNRNGKKISYGVNPPLGIIVDLEVIKKSPKELILAGVADLVSNLSAIDDWLLAHNEIGEDINELSFLLAKKAAIPILQYNKDQIYDNDFLLDLINGLITSGLSMIVSGNTRGTSGAEHLISHAIDEYFTDKSTIHGLQVGWAHLIIERKYRGKETINNFFRQIGLFEVINSHIQFDEKDFLTLLPYAMKIRNRYTILNKIKDI